MKSRRGLGPARSTREVKAEAASGGIGQRERDIFISQMRHGQIVTFKASEETILSPGDVVEVKLTHQSQSPLNEAVETLKEET